MKQRVISVFLAIVMLVSIFPTTGYATNEGDTTEIDTGDVSIEGTNGFGALLSTELTRNQTEATEGQSEYEAGYSVTALDIVGNTATVEYNSMETAVLVVAIYSEDWMQLLASGQVIVSSEENQAVVTIEGEMPEYFQAMAYLMDTYDLSPLCTAYSTPLYTQEMQELLASTVHDYDEDRVLNLDEDETTNFAVYSEDTIVIEEQVGVNTIISADDATATYVIQNADESITSLVVGDVFVYPYGDSDILIIKVAEISINGTTVTIIGDNTLEMEEVFDAVKIEGESDTSDIVVDDSTADEGITYLGEQVDGDAGTYDWQGGNTMTVSKKFKFEEKLEESTEGGGVSVSFVASGTILLKLDVGVKYYLSLKTQYIEFKVTPKADFSVEIEAKIDLAKKIGYLFVSPCPCVRVGFEPELQAKFSGKLSTQLTIFMVIGFKYDNDSGIQNISTAPDLDLKVNVDGTIFLGLDFCPKIKILDDAVAFAEVNMLVGGEIKATTSGYMYEVYEDDAPSRHQCRECVAMDINIVAKIGGTLKFLDIDWLTVKINIGEWKFPLGEMYYSIDKDIFDSGSCPNLTYRVTIEVVDADGNPVPDLELTVNTANEPPTTNENGVAVFYTRAGIIRVKAEKDGCYASTQQSILSAKKIKLTLKDAKDEENEESAPGGVIGDIDPGEIVDPGMPEEPEVLVDSGSCGDNVTWALYDSGLLKIYGSGEMRNYSYNNMPWFNYTNNISTVIIEDGVTTIGKYAFYGCDVLTNVTISNSVTSIGERAFCDCTALTSVTIPDSVTTIGKSAFAYCDSLTSVTIPNSVTTIGNGAFYYCGNLTSVTIGNGVTIIGNQAFYQCDSLTSVTIGNSVITIGEQCFFDCDSLTSMIVPNSVTTIESQAFYQCDSLANVTIGNGVTTIGNEVFYYCGNLTSVTIGNGVTIIGNQAFYQCDSLTSVTIGDSVTTIGKSAFAYCDALTSVTIPNSVTTIGNQAFYQCDSLTSVTIGNSVTTIGDYVFADCASLTSMIIPDSVATIGDYAFNRCSSLTGVTIGNNVITIGNYAFRECDILTSVTIGSSVTAIGDYAFYWCPSLTSVTMPDSVTTIGDYAFYGCSSLTDVAIPDSVTTIGDYIFAYCSALVSVTIGNSVTTIGNGAFYSCVSLTSITIPDSVVTIGKYPFYECYSLTEIYVNEKNPNYFSDNWGVLFDKHQTTLIQAPGGISGHYTISDSVTTIEDYAFYCSRLTSVTIGNNVITIGNYAFRECDILTSVTIGDSVTAIGDYAFYYCDSLTDVYYAGTEEQWNEISIDSGNEDLLNANIHYSTGNSAHAVDESIGVMSISESNVRNSPYDMDTANPSAVYPGDYDTEDTGTYLLKTASFTGLVPGQQYILLALRSLETDNPLSSDNLLYIYQTEALEDGTLTFQYIQHESVGVSYVMACGASNKNLGDAQIIFPEMTADGTLWTVNPTVVYDGKTLTEGKDYVITGAVDYTEAGEYICYIRGIYNYTGLEECHYTVEPSEPTSDILRGDVNGDGYVNSNDSIYLLRYTLSPDRYPINQSGDMNGDGYVNSNDAIYLLRHTLTPDRYPLH